MTGRHPRDERLEFWERREIRFIAALPYVLLALSVGLDIASRGGLDEGAAIDLALAAAAAVTMIGMSRMRPWSAWDTGEAPPPTVVGVAAFLALYALMAALVIRQPLYGFYTFTGYFWAFVMLAGSARLVGVAMIAALSAISQTGGGPYDTSARIALLAGVYVINAGVATGFTWFGVIGNAQKERRAREIDELTETNAKLERTMRENAELQQQLLAQARATGVAEERRRMAREIHDTIAQGLAGIVTQLQAAQSATDDAGGRHVSTAIELARSSLTEARRSVQALAPAPLADARLPEAVREVAGRWTQLHGVPVSVTVTGNARPMSPELEVALLRTAQEALANVAKHAYANRVGLTLSYMEDQVTLDVRDDGVGFETVNGSRPRRPRDETGGFGLTAMRQRVEGVAGTLEIESELDGGTAISASVPAIPAVSA
jgi:signal transduction histidine kinase